MSRYALDDSFLVFANQLIASEQTSDYIFDIILNQKSEKFPIRRNVIGEHHKSECLHRKGVESEETSARRSLAKLYAENIFNLMTVALKNIPTENIYRDEKVSFKQIILSALNDSVVLKEIFNTNIIEEHKHVNDSLKADFEAGRLVIKKKAKNKAKKTSKKNKNVKVDVDDTLLEDAINLVKLAEQKINLFKPPVVNMKALNKYIVDIESDSSTEKVDKKIKILNTNCYRLNAHLCGFIDGCFVSDEKRIRLTLKRHNFEISETINELLTRVESEVFKTDLRKIYLDTVTNINELGTSRGMLDSGFIKRLTKITTHDFGKGKRSIIFAHNYDPKVSNVGDYWLFARTFIDIVESMIENPGTRLSQNSKDRIRDVILYAESSWGHIEIIRETNQYLCSLYSTLDESDKSD